MGAEERSDWNVDMRIINFPLKYHEPLPSGASLWLSNPANALKFVPPFICVKAYCPELPSIVVPR